MPCFCVVCHSIRGIARALARAREDLAFAQCKFASRVCRKQAAIDSGKTIAHAWLFSRESSLAVSEWTLEGGNEAFFFAEFWLCLGVRTCETQQ